MWDEPFVPDDQRKWNWNVTVEWVLVKIVGCFDVNEGYLCPKKENQFEWTVGVGIKPAHFKVLVFNPRNHVEELALDFGLWKMDTMRYIWLMDKGEAVRWWPKENFVHGTRRTDILS